MESLRVIRSNARLRLWIDRSRKGVFPGVVTGAVIGLAPGVLLVLVLTGGTYYIKASEVLGFVVMSVAAGALAGAAIGGLCAAIGGAVGQVLRRT